jgi:hypothetical protein
MEPLDRPGSPDDVTVGVVAADRLDPVALVEEQRWLRWSGVLPPEGDYAVVDDGAPVPEPSVTVVRMGALDALLLDDRELAAVVAGATAIVTGRDIVLGLAVGFGVPHAWVAGPGGPGGVLAAATGGAVEGGGTADASAVADAIGRSRIVLADVLQPWRRSLSPFTSATPVRADARRDAVARALQRADDERIAALDRAAAAEAQTEALRAEVDRERRLTAELQAAVVRLQLEALRSAPPDRAEPPATRGVGRMARAAVRRLPRPT